MEFSTSQKKSRHCVAGTCTPVPKPSTVNTTQATNTANNTIENSTLTNSSVTSTNVSININAPAVNDFYRTNTAPIVDMIMRPPDRRIPLHRILCRRNKKGI